MTVVRHPPRSTLVERAHDLLRGGPIASTELVASVCQLSGVPSAVAADIASALLAAHREFVQDADGRWTIDVTHAPRSARGFGSYTPDPTPPVGDPTLFDAAGLGARPSMAQLAGLPYVVVDVETTGGRAYGADRITEVAAVAVDDGRVTHVFESLVNPQRPIPPWITALTNISWAMVKDAPTFREVAPRLLEVLEGRVFVAHNATFDWRFICAEVERATGERLDGERLCTVRLARQLLPQLRRRSLDYVCLHYGVEIAARHRAGGDAVATAEVLLRLLGDAADRGIASWEELRALVDRRTGRGRRRRQARPGPVERDTTA